MFGLGFPELILILIVALLIFGPKKVPDLARSLGRGIKEFRSAMSEMERSIRDQLPDEDEFGLGRDDFSPRENTVSSTEKDSLPTSSTEKDNVSSGERDNVPSTRSDNGEKKDGNGDKGIDGKVA